MILKNCNINRIFAFVGLVTILLSSSCNKDDGPGEDIEDNFDRPAMLKNYATNIIIPAYAEFDSKAESLNNASIAFASEPDEAGLQDLRNSWLETLFAWQNVGFYDFGPAMDQNLINSINIHPTDTERINGNISSGNYNLNSAANTDAIGLQAMDFLINGIAETDGEIVDYFISTSNAAQYLMDISGQIKDKSSNVLNAWNSSYKSDFLSMSGVDIGSSVGLMVNSYIKYFEVYVRDGKIGLPAGARSSTSTPLPHLVEAYYYENASKECLIRSLEAMQRFFNGADLMGINGSGFDDYLNFVDASFEDARLSDAINQAFINSIEKTEVLNEPFNTAVVNQQSEALEVFAEMQKLVVLTKVDMSSALSIQITYVDNDGD